MCEQSEAGYVCVCRSTFICVDYRLRGTMQGTLDTFGVVEILQMLGRARRCGTLHIECPERLIDVHFVQGRIAETRDSTRVATDTVIGSQLLKRSLVNDAQLREALARQEAEPCPLGTLLVRASLSWASLTSDRLSSWLPMTVSVATRVESRVSAMRPCTKWTSMSRSGHSMCSVPQRRARPSIWRISTTPKVSSVPCMVPRSL